MSGDDNESTIPIELLVEAGTGFNEPLPTDQFVCIIRFLSK